MGPSDPREVLDKYFLSKQIVRAGAYAEELATGAVLFDYGSEAVFRSASTIKLAIAYELMRKFDAGEIGLDDPVPLEPKRFVGGSGLLRLMFRDIRPTVGCMLRLMLTVSDNTASNILIGLLGKSSINHTIRYLGLNNTRLEGKFMYPRKRRFNRTSPKDMAKLISTIYLGKGLSRASRRLLVRTLGYQQHTGLIPSSLPGWWVKTINKPGALSDLRADVAVVYGDGWAYSVAIFVEGFSDAHCAESCVRQVSRAIFDAYLAKRGKATRPLGR